MIFRPAFFCAQLLIFSFICLVSCSDPVKPPSVSEEPPSSAPEEELTEPVPPASSSPEPTKTPPVTETPPEETSEPLNPVLDIREIEDAKKIVVSGHIASKYQAQDIFNGVANVFPGIEVVDELKIDSRIPQVVWGNRINDLLLPALHKVENMHFNYAEGVTLIEGTVGTRGEIGQVGKLVIAVMEAPDSRGITNKLVARTKE